MGKQPFEDGLCKAYGKAQGARKHHNERCSEVIHCGGHRVVPADRVTLRGRLCAQSPVRFIEDIVLGWSADHAGFHAGSIA